MKDPEVTEGIYLQVPENPPPVPPTRLKSQENRGSVSSISLGIALKRESKKCK